MKNGKNIEKLLEGIIINEIPSQRYRNILCINGDFKLEFNNKFEGNLDIINIFSNKYPEKNRSDIEDKILSQLLNIKLSKNKTYLESEKYDLIVISTIFYKKYLGNCLNLIYYMIDIFLNYKGILVMINETNMSNLIFPYLLLLNYGFSYKNNKFILEVYIK